MRKALIVSFLLLLITSCRSHRDVLQLEQVRGVGVASSADVEIFVPSVLAFPSAAAAPAAAALRSPDSSACSAPIIIRARVSAGGQVSDTACVSSAPIVPHRREASSVPSACPSLFPIFVVLIILLVVFYVVSRKR